MLPYPDDDERYSWKDRQRRGEREDDPLSGIEGLIWGGLFGALVFGAIWAVVAALTSAPAP